MWPFRSKSGIPSFAVENTIGAGTFVHGDLKGPGGFRIDGTVDGHVEADGPVIIGESGSVEGSIRARDVVLLGRVRGDIRATGHLEIGPNGKVVGDVSVTSLRMHKGGVFRGASRMAGAEDLVSSTTPFGMLPPERRRGRTLPPPDGAVVPPPPTHSDIAPLPPLPTIAKSQERLRAVDDDDERVTIERAAAND